MTSNPCYTSRDLNELWQVSSKTSVLGNQITHCAFSGTGRADDAEDGICQIVVFRATIKTLRDNVVLGRQVLDSDFSRMGHGVTSFQVMKVFI